jgi:sugar transferase (PEP-CTERM/EpsH1 system associated)
MRILYLCQRVPYPPQRGDKIATYHQIRHLARNHEVAVACLADGKEDLINVTGLSPFVTSVDAVPLARRRGHLRMLAALATGTPLTLAYFHESELHRRVAARIHERRIDAILLYSSSMAQFVEAIDNVPRIMNFCDLDSLKWRQYADNVPLPMRWVYSLEARRLLRYERYVAATFDHSLVCTTRELEDCRLHLPGALVSCVGNGVDLDYFKPMPCSKEPASLVFTGIMDYLPNVDGVVWFCEEVLPRIRHQVPKVSLTICGARPVRIIQALQRMPGVTVTGRVPDVRPFLARASLAIIPLRLGRGIQNKLLEAMAMGLPVVATSTAFQGVEASSGTDLLVANDVEPFAAAIVRLLGDDALRTRIGQAARATVERTYSWDAQLSALDAVLASVTCGRRCPEPAAAS